MAFHFLLQCRHPGARYFRGSMAGLYMPLSTLQGWPHGQPHMTQGRYGSLRLYRMTLSFTTTCRFSPALSGEINMSVVTTGARVTTSEGKTGTITQSLGQRVYTKGGKLSTLNIFVVHLDNSPV